MSNELLKISDLNVSFKTPNGNFVAVDNLSLSINKGETVALVGESGSGKSTTALSILGLLAYPMAFHNKGSIKFKNIELLNANDSVLQKIRGNKVGMIFQEPMMSLNPLHKIKKQIKESLIIHNKLSKTQISNRIFELLNLVGLYHTNEHLNKYPHQLSGGQRQRVMIAIAIANNPDLLIADEPTTALDVTIQLQILSLLKDIQSKLGMSILLITHDLNIVRHMAQNVYIMNKGNVIEFGKVKFVLTKPKTMYTKSLLKAVPLDIKRETSFSPGPKILSIKNLKVYFPIKKGFFNRTIGYFKAVDDISLFLHKGTTLGIVGESGSGKTTLAQAILNLIPSTGNIFFKDINISTMDNSYRRHLQYVFQDPFSSLSPRLSVHEIIAEGLEVNNIGNSKQERKNLVLKALNDVGMNRDSMYKYPHEFSGGQRQRIAIARALALNPEIIICDEAVSALDVSIQAQIIKLLSNLRNKFSLSYIFIAHDLPVVRDLADRVIVMKSGKIVEEGIVEDIFDNPQHSYTQDLLKASPLVNKLING